MSYEIKRSSARANYQAILTVYLCSLLSSLMHLGKAHKKQVISSLIESIAN